MFRMVLFVSLASISIGHADRVSDWPPQTSLKTTPSRLKPAKATRNNCDVDAGYEFSFGAADKPASPEMHTVHVYEASSGRPAKSPRFTLTIDRPGEVYLDLSA